LAGKSIQLKCTSALPDPLAGFNGSYFKGKKEDGGEERVMKGVEEWEGLRGMAVSRKRGEKREREGWEEMGGRGFSEV